MRIHIYGSYFILFKFNKHANIFYLLPFNKIGMQITAQANTQEVGTAFLLQPIFFPFIFFFFWSKVDPFNNQPWHQYTSLPRQARPQRTNQMVLLTDV